MKRDLSKAMEYIVKEGKKDAGPQMMQIVTMDIIHELAQAYALGKRQADEQTCGDGSSLARPEQSPVGLAWQTPSESDPEMELSINKKLQKHRGLDIVNNLLDEAKEILIKWDRAKPLPDTKFYMDLVKDNKKLSPKEMIKFVVLALCQQWDPYLEKRPEDIKRSVENLKKEALSYLIYIWEGADEQHGRGFNQAEHFAKLLDSIMRIPSRPKNISYWEKGGNIEKRREMEGIKERLRNRFVGGTQSGTSVSNFVQRTIDNTFQFPDEISDRALQRAVLFLSGPLGTNPTEQAKRIYTDLGLHPIVMSLEEYVNLFETGREDDRYGRSRGDNARINFNLDSLLGRLKPLLQGDHYNCGIVISDARFDKPEVLEKARRYLAPDVTNPKVSLSDVEKCEFEIPLTEISVILTSSEALNDPALKLVMWEERIEKISEEDRRQEVEAVVMDELTKLDLYEIPFPEKEKIRDTVDKMMWYCLQNNMDHDAGPEPLVKAVRFLFSDLSVRARQDAIGSAPKLKAPDRPDDKPLHLQAGFSLSWERVVRANLPSDLVEMVDIALDGFRSIQASGAQQTAPTTAPQLPRILPLGVPNIPPGPDVSQLREELDDLKRQMTAALAAVKEGPQRLEALQAASEMSAAKRVEKARQTTLDGYVITDTDKLCDAVEKGDLKRMEEVLRAPGLNPNRRNKHQRTALHVGVMNHQLEACKLLLDDPKVNTALIAKNEAGRTPLHIASDDNQGELTKLILASPASKAGLRFDVNERDQDGATALALAASASCYKAAEALLEVAATDATVRDNSDHTPFHRAISKGDSKMLDLLLEKRTISKPLRTDLIKWALEQDKNDIARGLMT